ncbi:DUF3037 domain-containing protein [Flaviaesturariibacter aridisoli]|uniref:DUF3037 domain-containing protein n=2 Tax=Flaviaesturariibacter aridisoli TaxID=2545761 RepID=A0A4R4DYQ0_9BACT|nr:DUF3037 domain-containing protein [Flaviaesturariibacter aridisoli]
MPAPLLYEYAVIRVVPRVERDEFLNAGVVLYCRQQKRILVRMELDEARLRALSPAADLVEIRSYLDAFARIARGEADSGPIARLDAASRFRWLTAVRSTVIQTSRVHPGFCSEPDAALDRLFQQLVAMPVL